MAFKNIEKYICYIKKNQQTILK